MHSKTLLSLLPILAALGASASPFKREVPQEHSHEQFLTTVRASLNLNNPDQIADPVFGLLGNAAAAGGQGKISDTDCLQQATADQAFTNAKAAGDVTGMTAALIYRGLERNTGKVGLASVLCTAIKAKNPEIAAISQHQDPASTGAAATNKAIALALAAQIASIGGNPLDALKSGTFAPGDLNDNTGKGNTCDETDDPVGCIFTRGLLVEDASEDEILAAVGGAAGGGATPTEGDTADAECTTATVTVTVAAAATSTPATTIKASAVATVTTPAAATGGNLQTFTGALNGFPPTPVTAGGRGFLVKGDSFLNLSAALQRSCAQQHNGCADAFNSGKGTSSVSACDAQEAQCNAAGQ